MGQDDLFVLRKNEMVSSFLRQNLHLSLRLLKCGWVLKYKSDPKLTASVTKQWLPKKNFKEVATPGSRLLHYRKSVKEVESQC